jgi:nucleoside-diphosphate-sugar epimerase
MKILVVGGRSSLAQALKPILSLSCEVITAGPEGCDVYLNLNDQIEKIEIPSEIDVVINTAAHFGGETFQEILQAENVNVLGSLKLAHACVHAGIKHFVHISSIFAELDRNSPFYSIYSLSKKHAEDILTLYSSKTQLPLTIIRPSQIYGVGKTFRKHQPFLFTIIDKAENNEEISFYGSNDALRNFIHVEDVANVVATIVKMKLEGIYSCVNPQNVSYSEIAKAAIIAFESKSVVKFIEERPDIPSTMFPANDQLFRLINYYPQISISDGMKKEAIYRKGAE